MGYKSVAELNAIGAQVLDACISVHKEFGPGLLESVYIISLLKELEIRDINALTKICVPLFYKGFDTGKIFEIDMLIENEIILEAKSVTEMHPVYEAQIISYLKLTGKRLGYLVNFNVPVLKSGFRRFVNNI